MFQVACFIDFELTTIPLCLGTFMRGHSNNICVVAADDGDEEDDVCKDAESRKVE